VRFSEQELSELTATLLHRSGAALAEAAIVADILVWCDSAGRSTQGVWRLGILCERLAARGIRSPCEISVEHITPGCVRVDGGDGSGHFICHQATLEGIKVARETGFAALAVTNSNHCGALGYYAWLAARKGMIAFLWSNAFAKVAAFGGNKPILGTNPMAFGAPRRNGAPVIVDLATSAAAGSTARLAQEEDRSLENGVAESASGQPLHDASLLDSGYLLPFGGAKGYALALVCEIVCSVLASEVSSRDIRSLYGDRSSPGKNGQFIILLDPSRFVSDDDYDSRLQHIIVGLVSDNGSARIPGDARSKELETSKTEGVRLSEHTVNELNRLCEQFDVPILQTITGK